MTSCVAGKGILSATLSATPKHLCTQPRISVDKKCYDLTSFGRQKVTVNRKYGHDTQGVVGSSFINESLSSDLRQTLIKTGMGEGCATCPSVVSRAQLVSFGSAAAVSLYGRQRHGINRNFPIVAWCCTGRACRLNLRKRVRVGLVASCFGCVRPKRWPISSAWRSHLFDRR